MDLPAYINSGVLELYVLDRLSPDERRRVEAYAEEHPEVRQEIDEIERALESYAVLRGHQQPPDSAVLSSVLSRIKSSPSAGTTPVRQDLTPRSGPNYTVWILAIGLLLALAALAYFFVQNRQGQLEMSALQQTVSALEADCADCNQLAQDYEADQQQLAVLTDVDTRNILLAGSTNAPNSRAIVFYNSEDGNVLFSASNLPAPPAGKQYQLWAIDAQGPQSLGVLDQDLSPQDILTVPYVPNAAAFAITLEDEGGKPEPDLTQLQVIGEVGS